MAGRPLVQRLAAGLGVAAVFLAPAWFIPTLFGHSTYLLGLSAVLFSAGLAGGPGIAACAIVFIIAAPWIDHRAGIREVEIFWRIAIFSLLALGLTVWAHRLGRFQRRSQQALGELYDQRQVLRTVLDTAPDAMIMIDDAGTILDFSLGAESLFGWPAPEIVGRNVAMLMPERYSREPQAFLDRFREPGEDGAARRRREVEGLRKDGGEFPMSLHVGALTIAGQRRYTGFVRDMTDLNQARSRTEELRLHLTQVWRLNSLGEMAATLAHELNQPLSAITNYMRGARNLVSRLDPPQPELVEALAAAGDQALRAGEIIRHTRSMIAHTDLEHRPESLSAMLLEMEGLLELMARDASVVVEYDFTPGDDWVQADRIQVQQVIGNLFRNAIEALAGLEDRRIRLSTELGEDEHVCRLEDSGPGVPPGQVETLFKPVRSAKNQGMGLGLSISRSLIEAHKGRLWVETSRLGGAAFCFSLPVTERPGGG